MNKKQLEKEVLRLKSQGLNKEQIKTVLTKSEDTVIDISNIRSQSDYLKFTSKIRDAYYNKPVSKNDLALKSLVNYLIKDLNYKEISICRIEKYNDEIKFKFKTDDLDIKISDFSNRTSSYDILYKGYSIKLLVDKNEIDLLNSITTVNNVSLSILLRWVCFGIINSRTGRLAVVNFDDTELNYYVKNINNYDLNKLKDLIISYEGNNMIELMDFNNI